MTFTKTVALSVIISLALAIVFSSIQIEPVTTSTGTGTTNVAKQIKMENVSEEISAKPNRVIKDVFGSYDFKSLNQNEKNAKMELYKKVGLSKDAILPNQSQINEGKMKVYLETLSASLVKKFGYAGSGSLNGKMMFTYKGDNFICKPIFERDYASGYSTCINDNSNENAPDFTAEINSFLKTAK